MREPTSLRVAALERAVLKGEGHTAAGSRRAAFDGAVLPPPLNAYAERVRNQSYRLTDADLAALAAAGVDEDTVFEITVAAAIGEAAARLRAGLRALEQHP